MTKTERIEELESKVEALTTHLEGHIEHSMKIRQRLSKAAEEQTDLNNKRAQELERNVVALVEDLGALYKLTKRTQELESRVEALDEHLSILGAREHILAKRLREQTELNNKRAQELGRVVGELAVLQERFDKREPVRINVDEQMRSGAFAQAAETLKSKTFSIERWWEQCADLKSAEDKFVVTRGAIREAFLVVSTEGDAEKAAKEVEERTERFLEVINERTK